MICLRKDFEWKKLRLRSRDKAPMAEKDYQRGLPKSALNRSKVAA